MKINDISSQLGGKRKTVKDLARFIKNRNDDNPNYTLFLGAGCSVTSGIRSASELIREWRTDLCKERGYHDEDPNKQINFLKANESEWYDPSREYSSLFERKYDLQRQRRIFVEKEVANKTPSLGYAYLTSLVNQTYFNTIFTTNFDDLINEAFYFYSVQRPIVCAHDSSIDSITVTSKRPKIIKLHGDYLFDDIKATTRETETLEQNMKSKFIEFAKDYGLIVVGYSGCDRSIMDILSLLLKNETYFKHGVYWCLRSDSEISEDLKKLLWRDKVYFVEIEGFDELFAEIYCHDNQNAELPVSSLSISKKPSEMVGNLLKSPWLANSNSQILKDAYEALRKQHAKSNLLNLIINKEGDLDNQINDQDLISLVEMQQLYESGKFTEVIEKGKLALQNDLSDNGRIRIINLLISAFRAVNNTDEALRLVNQLINQDKFNPNHYILKSQIEPKIENKLSVLNEALSLNEYSVPTIAKIIDTKFLLLRNALSAERLHLIEEIKELCKKALQIDPSLDNPCWDDLMNISSEQGSEDEIKKSRKEIISKIQEMNPKSLKAYSYRLSVLNEDEDNFAFQNWIDEVDKLRKEVSKSKSINLLELAIKGLIKFNNSKLLNDHINEALALEGFYKYENLVISVAHAKRKIFGDENGAIEILEKALSKDFDSDIFNLLFRTLIENDRLSEAEALFDKNSFYLTEVSKLSFKELLHLKKEEFQEAISVTEKRTNLDYIENSHRMYVLIKAGKFAEAKMLGRDILEPVNYSTENCALIVNYELARKRLNESPSDKRLNDVLTQHKKNDEIKAAVYATLGKKHEMLESIRKVLKKDKTFKYDLRDWPVFDHYRKDNDFTSLCS